MFHKTLTIKPLAFSKIDGSHALGAKLIECLDGIDKGFLDHDIAIAARIRKALKATARAWTSETITESCWSAIFDFLYDLQKWTTKEWAARCGNWFGTAAECRIKMQELIDAIGDALNNARD